MFDIVSSFVVIITAMISCGGYAAIYYAQKWVLIGGEINYRELISTLIVGVVIGAVFAYSGNPLGQTNFLIQLASYGAVIGFVDQMLVKIFPAAVKNYRAAKAFSADGVKRVKAEAETKARNAHTRAD